MTEAELQTIEDLKKGIILTGKLSEWHVTHLKLWPSIVFNEEAKCAFESVEIDYDFSVLEGPEAKSYVTFKIRLKNKRKPRDFKARCKALSTWVKNIFWKETIVSVVDEKGKVLFKDSNE